MGFEIHFEFRASLRKFQDLNFWDATVCDTRSIPGGYGHRYKILPADIITGEHE
jgi:hypothetical protein